MNRREFPKELQEYYRDFEGSYRLPATPSKETDHVDIRTVTLTRQETQRLKTKCEQKGISLPGYVEYCFGRGLLIALSKETAWFSHTYSGRDENCVKMAEYIRPWKNRRALRFGKCRNLKGILKEDDALPYEKGTLLIAASRKKDIPVVSEYLAHRDAERQVIRFLRWPPCPKDS